MASSLPRSAVYRCGMVCSGRRRSAFLVACLLGLCAATDNVTQNFGSSGCPCIEWAGLDSHIENGFLVFKPLGSLLAYNYPANYGSVQCKKHDEGLPPNCHLGLGSDDPLWCTQEWCYVDHKNCNLAASKSRYFEGVDDLYYSYDTCAGAARSANSFESWDLAGIDGTTQLIGLIQGYLQGSRTLIEDGYMAIQDWDQVSSCGFDKMCPCLDCAMNVNWGMKIDLTDVGVWGPGNDPSNAVACLSQAIANTYLKVAGKEADIDGSRVGYQYFGEQETGGYVQWPNTQWCPASSYDPRFRPWYAAPSTGPKDVIIVVDVSGSMGDQNRAELAKQATKAILNTLSWKDFATIILFAGSVKAVFSNLLVSVTEAQRNAMVSWIEQQEWKNGGTNFQSAFFQADEEGHGAFKVIADSVSAGATSMCQKAILFLTDGQSPFSDEDFNAAKDQGVKYDTLIFTYAIGDGAQVDVCKRLACDNRGIFYRVPDGADLAHIMASYYRYFASGQEMCDPSFVEYSDAITGSQLYAGCLPMYDRSGGALPKHVGVSCMDLNILESIDVMQNNSGWHDLVCKMSDVSKTCRPLDLQECHIEKLRAAVSPDSVCEPRKVTESCPCIDQLCQDDPTFKDELGYYCDTWIGDDCFGAAANWGFSQRGQDEIILKCPRSCGQCQWKDPCPYNATSTCQSKPSSVQSFCRACETDKTSGVDIEGCYMTCRSQDRVCPVIVSGAGSLSGLRRAFVSLLLAFGVLEARR